MTNWETKRRSFLEAVDKTRTERRNFLETVDKTRTVKHATSLEMAVLYDETAEINRRLEPNPTVRLFEQTHVYRWIRQAGFVIVALGCVLATLSLMSDVFTGDLGVWRTGWQVLAISGLAGAADRLRTPKPHTVGDGFDPEEARTRAAWLAIANMETDRLPSERWPGQHKFWSEAEMLFAEHTKTVGGLDAATREAATNKERTAATVELLAADNEFSRRWSEFLDKWVGPGQPWSHLAG